MKLKKIILGIISFFVVLCVITFSINKYKEVKYLNEIIEYFNGNVKINEISTYINQWNDKVFVYSVDYEGISFKIEYDTSLFIPIVESIDSDFRESFYVINRESESITEDTYAVKVEPSGVYISYKLEKFSDIDESLLILNKYVDKYEKYFFDEVKYIPFQIKMTYVTPENVEILLGFKISCRQDIEDLKSYKSVEETKQLVSNFIKYTSYIPEYEKILEVDKSGEDAVMDVKYNKIRKVFNSNYLSLDIDSFDLELENSSKIEDIGGLNYVNVLLNGKDWCIGRLKYMRIPVEIKINLYDLEPYIKGIPKSFLEDFLMANRELLNIDGVIKEKRNGWLMELGEDVIEIENDGDGVLICVNNQETKIPYQSKIYYKDSVKTDLEQDFQEYLYAFSSDELKINEEWLNLNDIMDVLGYKFERQELYKVMSYQNQYYLVYSKK